jgi:DNA-binding transcriptional MerR regulator
MTLREAAERLKVDDRSVRAWREKGLLTAISLPTRGRGARRNFRFPIEEIERFERVLLDSAGLSR